MFFGLNFDLVLSAVFLSSFSSLWEPKSLLPFLPRAPCDVKGDAPKASVGDWVFGTGPSGRVWKEEWQSALNLGLSDVRSFGTPELGSKFLITIGKPTYGRPLPCS